MADPQTSSASENAAGAVRDSRQGASRPTGPQVEGERRTFDAVPQTPSAAPVAAANAARDVADAGRQALHQVAEAWRSPFDPFAAMQMDVSRWFDELWRQTMGFSPMSLPRSSRPFTSMSTAHLFGLPATDVRETEDAYVLAVELPGLARADIDLQVRGDTLVISGRKEEEKSNASAAYRISERRFGRIERSYPVPPDVDRPRIEAAFRDGVLTVRLPKIEQASRPAARIEIKD